MEPSSTVAAHAGAAALRAFATELHRLEAGSGESTVVSPWSIATALGMARAGADGPTGTEIDAALHAPDGPSLHSVLGALSAHLTGLAGPTHTDGGGEAEVSLRAANAVWVQDGFTLGEAFMDTVTGRYGGQPEEADFAGATEAARDTINAWVHERTGGRIPALIGPGLLTTLTRVVLTNAVHLKAPWATRFGPAQPAPFHLLGGPIVQADLMTTLGRLEVRTGDGWVAVTVPYAGHTLAMTVVLPDQGRFDDVDRAADLDAWTRPADGRQVRLKLPRFDLDVPTDLGLALRTLGIRLAFDPDQADFSPMTTDDDLHVSAVVHQATITVDEEGTEAAAATAVMMAARAAHREPEEPLEITVDRPFLFVVHDTEHRAPLFLGRVTTPV